MTLIQCPDCKSYNTRVEVEHNPLDIEDNELNIVCEDCGYMFEDYEIKEIINNLQTKVN